MKTVTTKLGIWEATEMNDPNDLKGEQMDKPRHPNVIRPWKVERIRKPVKPKSTAV